MLNDDVAQIRDLLRQIEAAENRADAAGLTDLMADDAVIMAPDQPVQEGKATCAEFMTRVLNEQRAHFQREIRYVSGAIEVWGDHAVDRGTFAFTAIPLAGGRGTSASGKYFFAYTRSAGGPWKLARAI